MYVTIADADIGSLKSLRTLFDKYFGPHAGELWTKLYGLNHTIFFFKVHHFWQSVAAILKDVSVTQTIAWTFWSKTSNLKTNGFFSVLLELR